MMNRQDHQQLIRKRPRLPLLVIATACISSLILQLRMTDIFASVMNTPYYMSRIFEDEADYIIRKSYQNSYAHILPCETSVSAEQCLDKTHKYLNPQTEEEIKALPENIPWWFQTLLRDSLQNGLFGVWHHFTTLDPALNFCTIEKNGSTEWIRVFCEMNGHECPDVEPSRCVDIPGRECAWETKDQLPADAPWAVFLRDPLERLLSAYLDKCYKIDVRRKEGHCEPNVIFNPDTASKEGKFWPWASSSKITDSVQNKIASLTADLEDNKKQMFAAYLEVMPLKWNLHFFPQAFYCDLYRSKDKKYSFVGHMGKNFMSDLEKMAIYFGGRLSHHLDKVFGYLSSIEVKRKNNTGKEFYNHATHAPEKVEMFYSAATVRKALEYLSIDYVTLGFEVPEWARQMLREDI